MFLKGFKMKTVFSQGEPIGLKYSISMIPVFMLTQ